MLRSHYRSPIEVTPDTIAQAEAGLGRLDELARRFALSDLLAGGPLTAAASPDGDLDDEAVAAFVSAMDSDLDTPGALATVFDLARRANAAADAGDDHAAGRAARSAVVLAAALGLRIGAAVDDEVDDRRPPSSRPETRRGRPGTGPVPTRSGRNSRPPVGWWRTAPRARASGAGDGHRSSQAGDERRVNTHVSDRLAGCPANRDC